MVYLAPVIGVIALWDTVLYFRIRAGVITSAFLASSLFIFLMLVSVMFGHVSEHLGLND